VMRCSLKFDKTFSPRSMSAKTDELNSPSSPGQSRYLLVSIDVAGGALGAIAPPPGRIKKFGAYGES